MADVTAQLPRVVALCRRFERLYTGAISDVLDEMGHRHQVLPAAIAPLSPGARLSGTALTVLGERTGSVDPEVVFIPYLRMLGDVRPGHVIVSQPNDHAIAHFGELSAETAKHRGGRGAVIDGGCRDVEHILALGFPVFCRYVTPQDIAGRWRLVDHNVPIRVGEVDVHPGDFVVGDRDGVLVIPRAITLQVLRRAEEVAATEDLVRKAVLDGVHPVDAFRRFARF